MIPTPCRVVEVSSSAARGCRPESRRILIVWRLKKEPAWLWERSFVGSSRNFVVAEQLSSVTIPRRVWYDSRDRFEVIRYGVWVAGNSAGSSDCPVRGRLFTALSLDECSDFEKKDHAASVFFSAARHAGAAFAGLREDLRKGSASRGWAFAGLCRDQ